MERKIGEIFEYKGEWYQCLKSASCGECAFLNNNCINDPSLICSVDDRTDHCSVIFKKLEKVVKPFIIAGKLYQHYKVFDIDNVCGNGFWCVHNYKSKILTVEIKQNKEDMEEKKPIYEELLHYYHSTAGLWAIDRSPQEVSLDWICDNAFQLGLMGKDSNFESIRKNLKPFDLQAAKAGKPVCTRDGRKARIICFDMNANSPIVALVDYNGQEVVVRCHNDGRNYHGETTYNDLMMFPEKKEGWVNIVRGSDGRPHMGRGIFQSKEEAENAIFNDNLIDTVKICWEE